MKKENKITSISIIVPYKSPGNNITQHPVTFDVYRTGDEFIMEPRLSEDELRIANLPPELKFSLKDGKPESARGAKDGNFHVIQDAVSVMKELKLIP